MIQFDTIDIALELFVSPALSICREALICMCTGGDTQGEKSIAVVLVHTRCLAIPVLTIVALLRLIGRRGRETRAATIAMMALDGRATVAVAAPTTAVTRETTDTRLSLEKFACGQDRTNRTIMVTRGRTSTAGIAIQKTIGSADVALARQVHQVNALDVALRPCRPLLERWSHFHLRDSERTVRRTDVPLGWRLCSRTRPR